MKLSLTFAAGPSLGASIDRLAALERAGLDQVLVPESYGYDALAVAAAIATRTERLEIGTGIVNVYSRSAGVLAMAASTIDELSGGRFLLGLGTSGRQVVEGFHGVAFDQPVRRLADYTEACRMAWRREPLAIEGGALTIPLSRDGSTSRPLKMIQRPFRPSIPIWWASVKPRSVELAAEVADGWLPAFFAPEHASQVWGASLGAGIGRRPPSRAPLEIAAGGIVAVGDDLVGPRRESLLDLARPHAALYIGGMGARGANFYNDICRAYGFERAAAEIQDRFLAGDREGAQRSVPTELLEQTNLVGTAAVVAERVAAYRAAGVSTLLVDPVGEDAVATIARLRAVVDDVARPLVEEVGS